MAAPAVRVEDSTLSPGPSVVYPSDTGGGRDISDIDRRLGELHEFLMRAKAGGGGARVPLPLPVPPPMAEGSRPAPEGVGNEEPELGTVFGNRREKSLPPPLPPPEADASGSEEFSSGSISAAVVEREVHDGVEDDGGGGGDGGSLGDSVHDGGQKYVGDRNSEGDGVL